MENSKKTPPDLFIIPKKHIVISMKNEVRTGLLVLGDMIMLLLAFFIMIEISFYGEVSEQIIKIHFTPFLFVFGIWVLIFFLFNLYESTSIKPTISNLRIIGIASIIALTASTVLFYIIPSFGIAPKKNLVIFSIIFMIIFIIWRRIFYNIFSIYFRKHIVFIVDKDKNNTYVEEIKNFIENNKQSGFVIEGIYNSLEQFYLKNSNINPEVFIISKDIWENPNNFKKLYNTQSQVLDLASAYEDILLRIPIEAIDEGWFMHNMRSYNKKIYDLVKRILSIAIGILALLIISPILVIIAIAIKFYDGGPIFYSQLRVGKDGKSGC